ncbi:MAG: SCO family protein [Euryarchaeota archaeon]|jgi:cytochrome oxidase Cu insertion factor (SCO1/SenC/PrrC family)|nr:SCO family protein [Euryarchaeota archaeon]
MRRVVLALLLTSSLLLSGCLGGGDTNEPNPDFYGFAIDGAQVTDFSGIDQHGENFTYSNIDSKVTIVAFIFTRCPDVCPITTHLLSQVSTELGDKMEDVTIISISVDPEYDTPERLLEFTESHSVDWPHITGDVETMQAVWDDFGIFVDKEYIAAHVMEDNNSTMQMMEHRVGVVYPDNSTMMHTGMYGMNMSNVSAIDHTEHTLGNANVSYDIDNGSVTSIDGIEDTWELYIWNTTENEWQPSPKTPENITIMMDTGHIGWVAAGANASNLMDLSMNNSSTSNSDCDGNGYVMGEGDGAHCMCDEGYEWGEDNGSNNGGHLSCVPSADNDEYLVGHSTIMFLIDETGKKRVLWTGVSWDPELVAYDVRLLF